MIVDLSSFNLLSCSDFLFQVRTICVLIIDLSQDREIIRLDNNVWFSTTTDLH